MWNTPTLSCWLNVRGPKVPDFGLVNLISRLPGAEMLPGVGNKAHDGFFFDFNGTTVFHAGDGFVGAQVDEALDAVMHLPSPDVLVAAADGERVEGVVQAVRELAPKKVVLYRLGDPYAGGAPNAPIRRFIAALEEDSPEVEVVFLRQGTKVGLA